MDNQEKHIYIVNSLVKQVKVIHSFAHYLMFPILEFVTFFCPLEIVNVDHELYAVWHSCITTYTHTFTLTLNECLTMIAVYQYTHVNRLTTTCN